MADTVPGGARTVDLATERAALDVFCDAVEHDRASLDAWLAERCAGQATLLARVRELLAADAAAATPGPAFEETWVGNRGLRPMPPPPAQIGPYRLDELIGTGGMGAVYRAHRNDGLFDQQVAVKFVRSFSAPGQVDALIDAERRLLARMQHPGIARILDGGTTADGLHYLVMEFVQGLPIDEHAKRHELDARRRVALLREVCDAVADAHRHLVLHCDLKPANILVDGSGAPKLIDFGIARLRDAIDPALPHGFTRDYASPQRLAGEPPTVADDVYALGVLLVELLTGQRPGNAASARPDGALDAELAAIARQALAESPPARYASVDAFAADLQRWLALLPVAAFAGHWRYRARKLIQRHPWRVAAGALSLGGLVVALAVIATLYARADAARRDAEQRFGEVRSLANYMLFDLDARLESTPGTTAIRRGLVERSQQYLDTLAGTAGDRPELQREVAVGLGRLAEIQGGWAIPNLGERAAARPTFERAEAMLAALVQRRPGEWAWRRDLGRVQQRLGDFYGGVDNDARKQLAKSREAEANLQRALDAAVAMNATARDQAELHTLLSSARLAQAFAMDWIDESPAAIALATAEEARLLALPDALRGEMDFGYRAGRAAGQLGDSLFFLDRFEESLAAYRRAQQAYAQALERTPNDRRLLDGSAVSRWASSLALSELGRHGQALADNDTGLAMVARLIALDPGNDNAQRLMLILRSDRSMLLGRLSRHDEAIALAEDVLRERRARAVRAPDISEPARDAVVPLHALAELYWRQGDAEAACAASRRAIAAWAEYEKRWGLTELDRKQNAEKEREAAQRCKR